MDEITPRRSSRTERRRRGLRCLRYGVTTAAAQPPGTLDPTTVAQYESPLVIQSPLVIPPAMPSTRRIVQRGRPVDHYEIAVRHLAPGTQQHDPGAVATGEYVITPRSRPTVLWSDRAQFGPGGTVRMPFPRGGASATARSGRHLPLLVFHGEGVAGRGGTMNEAARDSALLHVRTDGAPAGPGCPAPPGPAPSGQPPGSHPASNSPRAPGYKGCRARRGRG
jgi:hypothetical protein